jgi:hypothetical protein
MCACAAAAAKASATAINVSGKTYEEEFDLETKRMAAPKVKNTPWGSSYRAAPEILHGEQRPQGLREGCGVQQAAAAAAAAAGAAAAGLWGAAGEGPDRLVQ